MSSYQANSRHQYSSFFIDPNIFP